MDQNFLPKHFPYYIKIAYQFVTFAQHFFPLCCLGVGFIGSSQNTKPLISVSASAAKVFPLSAMAKKSPSVDHWSLPELPIDSEALLHFFFSFCVVQGINLLVLARTLNLGLQLQLRQPNFFHLQLWKKSHLVDHWSLPGLPIDSEPFLSTLSSPFVLF